MSEEPSAGLSPLVSRNTAREAFAKALRLYVGYRGQRRRYTMAQLVEGSGVPKRVIECAMDEADSGEYRNPPLCAILSLAAFLGSSFTNEWLHHAGQLARSPEAVNDVAGDRAKESSVLKAALALSVALEDDGQITPDEILANRATIENARDALDGLLASLAPRRSA